MAMTLGRSRDPEWLELYNGAALLMEPATSVMVYTARAQAAELLAEIQSAGVAITKAGGQIVDTPETETEAQKEGVRGAMFVLCLAELGARDWRNILDAGGQPVPFDAGRLAELFIDPLVSEGFLGRFLAGQYGVVTEGNG